MRKSPYDRILRKKLKEQHLNTVFKFYAVKNIS